MTLKQLFLQLLDQNLSQQANFLTFYILYQQKQRLVMKNQNIKPTKKKYMRLNPSLKKIFLRKIFIQELSVRDAAKQMNINYSTAKTILFLHRKKLKAPHQQHQILKSLSSSTQNEELQLNYSQSKYIKKDFIDRTRASVRNQFSKKLIIISCSIGGSTNIGVQKICGYRQRSDKNDALHPISVEW